MKSKVRYTGDSVFRFGDRRIVKGEIVEGPPMLIDALLARGDFEPDGDVEEEKTPFEPIEVEEEGDE